MTITTSLEQLLSHEFPVVRQSIYLNHAAVAPWPRRTAEAVRRFASECAEQGAMNYPQWLRNESWLREQLARLINAPSPADIALLKNTSGALSVVAHGFPWTLGDNVVISDEEFPSNRIVWQSLVLLGVEVREVRLRGAADPEQALLDAADAQTRLLSISSVQYASGLRLDLERLGEGCRQRGIAFCVDAIQSLGALRFDTQAFHADFVMADAHKWLLGPEGIALFYCSPEWRERLELHEFGWHMVEQPGDFDRRDWKPAASARRFECGSPNMLGIHAFSPSVSLLLEIGMEEIEKRVLDNARLLIEAIAERPELKLITNPAAGRYAGIVTFRHRNQSAEQLHRHLTAQGVVCIPRGGGVRYSPHFYTPSEQLSRAVELAAAASAA
jgi:selenocysteine lyase/cysteine desulfurase